MWKCETCGRSFRAEHQHHFCGGAESIDRYIEARDGSVRAALIRVREVIRAAAPEAKEKISWQMPTFWQGENLIHFAPHKNHLGIYPGDLTDSPFAERLSGCQTAKGTIRFPYDKIDYDLIADIVKWRVGAAAKKGKTK
ncbi:MAG: DUF1801 domain-containing protein [Clostridiales bacterium]|jgi:uncharacterized protein YdhG (YjbR/CyaY superfamily)|nr:DUF1801 domain-containing protein [Clostridiales bacterium]